VTGCDGTDSHSIDKQASSAAAPSSDWCCPHSCPDLVPGVTCSGAGVAQLCRKETVVSLGRVDCVLFAFVSR
jgi:hypothetical protein